jgi:hypothetical protein
MQPEKRPKMSPRSERQRQHAKLMFRWHDQVAHDPALKRQTLAMKAMNLIRESVSANTLDAMLDHLWMERKLDCSRFGLQKALACLVAHGHLVIESRKHLGRLSSNR